MRRNILMAAVILATVPAMAQAQQSASSTLAVNVTLIRGLELTADGPALNFGTHAAGTATPVTVGTGSLDAMRFTAQGEGNYGVSLNFGTATLDGPGGASLTFTPAVTTSTVSAGQSTATSLAAGDPVNLSGTGFRYFWVGGSLGVIGAGQAAGAYTGNWTLEIAYTAF